MVVSCPDFAGGHPGWSQLLDGVEEQAFPEASRARQKVVGAKLVRSAYSTFVREASDASAALLDPNGQAVAQAELMIQQLGSLSATFGPCAEHHPVDTLVEGDFYINNDPYHGGQHLPDVFIFSPVFFEGELVAFGATVAHHVDIGGGAPGLNVNAREIYQEGLIIPPSRYNLDDDWNGGRLERLIATEGDRDRLRHHHRTLPEPQERGRLQGLPRGHRRRLRRIGSRLVTTRSTLTGSHTLASAVLPIFCESMSATTARSPRQARYNVRVTDMGPVAVR